MLTGEYEREAPDLTELDYLYQAAGDVVMEQDPKSFAPPVAELRARERERMEAEHAQRRFEYEHFGPPERPPPSYRPKVRGHKKRPTTEPTDTYGTPMSEVMARRRLAADIRARQRAADPDAYPDPDDQVEVSPILRPQSR